MWKIVLLSCLIGSSRGDDTELLQTEFSGQEMLELAAKTYNYANDANKAAKAMETLLDTLDVKMQELQAKTGRYAEAFVAAVEREPTPEAFKVHVVEMLEKGKAAWKDYGSDVLVALGPAAAVAEGLRKDFPGIPADIRQQMLKRVGHAVEERWQEPLLEGMDELEGYFSTKDPVEYQIRKLNAAYEDGAHQVREWMELATKDSTKGFSTMIAGFAPQLAERMKAGERHLVSIPAANARAVRNLVDGVHRATDVIGIEWGMTENFMPKM